MPVDSREDALSTTIDSDKITATSSVVQALEQYQSPDELLRSEMLNRENGGGVILEPWGADMYVGWLLQGDTMLRALSGPENTKYVEEAIEKNVVNKRVLVVPAYATNAFLFADLGAQVVVGADADPKTIGWLEVIRQYYGTDNIGDVLLDSIRPIGKRISQDKIQGMNLPTSAEYNAKPVSLLMSAVKHHHEAKPLDQISFVNARLGEHDSQTSSSRLVDLYTQDDQKFDFIYTPYLLGIKDGIETEENVQAAFNDLWQLANPNAIVMIVPFSESEQKVVEGFGADRGEVLKKLASNLPEDKFSVETRLDLLGNEVVFLRVKK